MYDLDVVSEEALLAWAAEKEHADESDKVFLHKVIITISICRMALLQLLRLASFP
jgi:hypothetical protein